MAAYNTAFGALPSVKTLTGGKRSSGAQDEGPKDFWQQSRAKAQSEAAAAPPPPTPTFADLQSQGQARPAPPVAATTPPMLSQLQTQLSEGAAPPAAPPAAAPPPATAPAAAPPPAAAPASAPVAAPAATETMAEVAPFIGQLAASMGVSPTGAAIGTPTVSPSGTATWTNVEVPVANPPAYKEGDTIPPTAPNGSTLTKANGEKWVKRGGLWVTETGTAGGGAEVSEDTRNANEQSAWMKENDIPMMPDGYAYVPRSQGGPGLRRRTYAEMRAAGYQESPYFNEARWNDPAVTAAYDANQWYAPILRNLGVLPPSQGRSDSAAGAGGAMDSDAAYKASMGTGVGVNAGAGIPNLGDGRSYTEDPNDAAYKASLGTGVGLSAGAGVPSTGAGAPSAGAAGAGTAAAGTTGTGVRSFNIGGAGGITAGLTGGGAAGTGAAGGVPPINFGTAPTFAPSQGAQDVQAQLRQILTQMQTAPSPFESDAYKAQLAAAEAELSAQYGAERSKLEEQLARQGLSASTFGAGRYGDLAGQQARAQASMRAELLKEAANQQAERQQVLLQGLTSLSGQMAQQEIAKYQADLDRYKTSGQFALDAQRLQQDARFRGIELSLQEARDLAENDYREGLLDMQLKELLSREKLTEKEIASREGISGRQISSTLLASLIPSLDLSGLSQEQLRSLFAGFGWNLPANISITPNPSGTQNAPNTSSGSSQTLDVLQAPTDLSPYAEGTIFKLPNGTTLQKSNGVLVDIVTGRVYDGRE